MSEERCTFSTAEHMYVTAFRIHCVGLKQLSTHKCLVERDQRLLTASVPMCLG